MTRLSVVAFTGAIVALLAGCSAASKEIRLYSAEVILIGKAGAQDYNLVVRDERGADGKIGATAWSLADVKTPDSVSDWFSDSLSRCLYNIGDRKNDDAPATIICKITKLDAHFGFWSTIDTALAVDVTVSLDNVETNLGTLEATHSPFAWFDTAGAYQSAVNETIKIWLENHAGKIHDALVAAKAEPSVEPEFKPEEPAPKIEPPKPKPAEFEITSHKSGDAVDAAEILITVAARNFDLGWLAASVNGIAGAAQPVKGDGMGRSVPVHLKPGDNLITIKIKPEGGEEVSSELRLRFVPKPLENLRALVVGVTEYRNEIPNRRQDNDAPKVHACLAAGVPPERKDGIKLLEKDVPLEKFMSLMKETLAAADENDAVIIYYGGTVIEIGGELGLAASDTDPRKPGSAVLFSDIALDMDAYFKGKSVLLITQGHALTEKQIEKLAASATNFSVLQDSPSEIKYGWIWEQLDGLADGDGDGYVTLGELLKALEGRKPIFRGGASMDLQLSRVRIP